MSGDHSDDPHVERLLQSAALLAAHLDVKLENEYPEFTEPLLEVLYPEYLRPIPSCSIAFFQGDSVFDELTQPITVERGTQLLAQTGNCRFQTVYDVTLSPLRIAKARYAATVLAPADVLLPMDTNGILSITFAAGSDAAFPDMSVPRNLRIYLDGQPEVVAALTDALFLNVASAFVEADHHGRWKPLSRVPVRPVGIDEDPIIPNGSPTAFSLLTEYLTFPGKFNFIDVDFSMIARKAEPSRQLTLHLAIRDTRGAAFSPALNEIGEANFKLHCTPIVNLFRQKAVPIKIDGRSTPYPVLPRTRNQSAVEVYAIDKVHAVGGALNEAVILPYYELTHSSAPRLHIPHWIMSQSESSIDQGEGYEAGLSIVRSDGNPTIPDTDQLTLDVICTDRNLPSAMPFGASSGDLLNETGSLPCKISLLSRPTERVRLPRRDGSLWRLIEFLTPHPLQLSDTGLDELKRLFRQFTTGSSARAVYFDGLIALTQRASARWVPMKPSPRFVRGIELILTVDEQMFVSNSLGIFIAVMDRFFARYAPANSFVQLVVVAKDTKHEIQRCPLRQGTTALL
ncbi:type VI secretion system protein ImpG [Paraburkholderia megapolitana]|uniref:Type VI secretion system protein ImpG n=2 Tax=Paraburkholderia megapolitana TaxID=420953 RepID=A0A1I3UQ86_9BURK|nr:type VI secretion system protein ImpG [Paraburkholderia megapolitana]